MRQLSLAYRPRRPTETVLYRVLSTHLASFIEQVEAAERPLPDFVRKELEGLLQCGRFEFGFVSQECSRCDFLRLIGLPCGGRGVCPSCLGRRMIAGAARLTDSIFPDVPVRQWVLSLPVPLRFALAYDADLCTRVLSLFTQEMFRWLKWTAKRELGLRSVSDAHCGAFSAIHRVGSYGNLNLHYHTAALDGVYIVSSREGPPTFRSLPAPKKDDLLEISARVYRRVRELFIGLGRDWEERSGCEEPSMVQEPLLAECAQASVRNVGLLGEQAGQSLLPLGEAGRMVIPADLQRRELTGGFDLQASRRVSWGDRVGRERLFRYLLHPPLAHDRLELTEEGRVRLKFSRAWRNGRDAMVLEPLNFIARLVPMIPAPGTHQTRYFGVLAARSRLRAQVIPERPPDGAQLQLFKRSGKPTQEASCRGSPQSSKPQRIAWARLLKRMAGYAVEVCPECDAPLVITSAVLEPSEIRRVLARQGLLEPRLTPLLASPSRGPPQGQLSLDFEGDGLEDRATDASCRPLPAPAA